jgi:hypothetical protein
MLDEPGINGGVGVVSGDYIPFGPNADWQPGPPIGEFEG